MGVAANWQSSTELAQFGASRPARDGDGIDGVQPALVIEPETPEQVAAAVAWASREQLATVIRGRGTKLAWGRKPARVDVVLSTTALSRQIVHRHGDLTATVPAGVTLTDLNRQLASQGQWLPLDTAFEHATVGGLIATNDSGPLRHRYGTPRDLLIGITLAMTDGTLVKSGGHVVKNVAGYDLGKLVSGSFGTLAPIVDATFKLLPIPQTSQTLLVSYSDGQPLSADVATLAGSQLEPVALDLHVRFDGRGAGPCGLAVRFATSPEATAAQIADAQRTVSPASQTTQVLTGGAEAAWWSEQVRRPWGDHASTVRLSWLPADLPHVLQLFAELQRVANGSLELTARAGLGAGFLCIETDDVAAAKVLERLRSAPLLTHVVVLRHAGVLKGHIDPWGPPLPSERVLQALKRSFDPAGILNAGRGPI
jgi:glycolate oxidase FAD binding subunit